MGLQVARKPGILPHIDWLLVAVLSTTAGAVDVIGFLALMGLFTAHITGNQRWVTARAPPAHDNNLKRTTVRRFFERDLFVIRTRSAISRFALRRLGSRQ